MGNDPEPDQSDDALLPQPRRSLLKLLGVGALSGVGASRGAASHGAGGRNSARSQFVAQASGEEVVPSVDTRGRGIGRFRLAGGGSHFEYELLVYNIEDVTGAHIHYEVANENGPVIAELFSASTAGPTRGTLASGTITDDDLVGPFEDKTVSDLLSAFRKGHAYVQVHTQDHPGGEIRGQIGDQGGPGSGQVTFIHDTHFHGRFENLFVPTLNVGNYFGLMNRIDRNNVGTMKVGNGDDLASSLLSSFFFGKHIVDAFNAGGLRYDTYGNHDFDQGPDNNRERVSESEFTWVSANLRDERTGDVWARDLGSRTFVLDEVGDVTVGVTGLINEEAPEITSLGEHATVVDIEQALHEVTPAMKAAGADIVAVLSHVSSQVMEEVLADNPDLPIDAVIGDHAGLVFEDGPKEIEGTLLSAVGDQFAFVGELTLHVEHGERTGYDFTLHDLGAEVGDGLAPDPEVAAIQEEYSSRLDEIDETIGQTNVPLDTRESVVRAEESNVGNYTADKMREFTDADVGLMNGGGIRTDTLYFEDATEANPADISKLLPFNVFPFGNAVVKLEVDGATIRSALENGVSKVEDGAGRFPQVSGMSYTWDPSAEAGSRITEVQVDGEPLDDEATYTLATNNFLSGGGDGYNMFTDVPRLIDANAGPVLAQLMVDQISEESPIAPDEEGRISEV